MEHLSEHFPAESFPVIGGALNLLAALIRLAATYRPTRSRPRPATRRSRRRR